MSTLETMLVPVLAGYWFLSSTYVLKRAYIHDKGNYELFFASAICGGLFYVSAWVVANALGYLGGDLPFWQRAKLEWQHNPPLGHSVTIALSVLIAFVASKIIDCKISNEEAAARWAAEKENRIGWILRE